MFKKWHLPAIIFAGTLVRFVYGYYSKAWLQAPDQLAWGLDIDAMLHNKTWNYTQLTHAPHEGGSFLISVFSLLFRPLQLIMPSLSFAALAIDTASRFIQVRITQKLFGTGTARWFGLWTIFSVPLIIPWATVNFGLHSLLSFIPFIFLYFAIVYKENIYLPVICGVITGLAISLSYDSIILVPASILFLAATNHHWKTGIKQVGKFVLVCSLVLLPHLFARTFLYVTQTLYVDPAFAIRGVPLDHIFTVAHFKNLLTVWYGSLPGSFWLSSVSSLPAAFLCSIVFLFLLTGISFYVSDRSIEKNEKWLPVCIVVLFVMAYAMGPFYGSAYNNKSYVYYRHLCYIIPLITVLMIHGFSRSGKIKSYIAGGWVALCSLASLLYIISTKPVVQPAYRPAGWILSKKYGDKIPRLVQIYSTAEPQYREEILVGLGWGLSAGIFSNQTDTAAIEKITRLIHEYPANDQPAVIRGVYYSFTKGITPVLDQQLPAKLALRLPLVISQ